MKDKIIIAKTEISKTDLRELKEASGAETNKEALNRAVKHYIECQRTDGSDKKQKRSRRKRPGRKPVYIPDLDGNSEWLFSFCLKSP